MYEFEPRFGEYDFLHLRMKHGRSRQFRVIMCLSYQPRNMNDKKQRQYEAS